MTDLWKKRDLPTRTEIVVLGAPPMFEPALDALAGGVTVRRMLHGKVPCTLHLYPDEADL